MLGFIREEIGRQLEIYNISEYITEYVGAIIETEQRNGDIDNGQTHEAIFPIRKTEHIIQETKINSIRIELLYIKTNVFKISGSFDVKKVRLNDNGNYDITIQLNIENDNRNINSLKQNIESVISHELNHAFVHIKKINKLSKTASYNQANKMTGTTFKQIPELAEFMKMFYLASPEEIQARVQQTASELRYVNSSGYNETISQLLQFNPLNDARKMINYNLHNIQKLSKKTLDNFVTEFNLNLKAASKDNNFKPITNTNWFFEYWLKLINEGGEKLFKKITKLVAQKHNLDEQQMYMQFDDELLTEITGDYFKPWNR